MLKKKDCVIGNLYRVADNNLFIFELGCPPLIGKSWKLYKGAAYRLLKGPYKIDRRINTVDLEILEGDEKCSAYYCDFLWKSVKN